MPKLEATRPLSIGATQLALPGGVPNVMAAVPAGQGGLDGLAQAFGEGAELASEMTAEQIMQERESLFSNAKADSYARLEELVTAAEQETDPEAVRKHFNDGLASLHSEITARFKDHPKLRSAWEPYWNEQTARYKSMMEGLRQGKVKDQGVASLMREHEALLGSLPSARSDEEIEVIIDHAMTALERKQATGILSATEAEKQRQAFKERVDLYLLKRDLNDDPEAVLKALQGTEKYPHLDPVVREEYEAFTTARIKQLKAEEEAERKAAQAELERVQGERINLLSERLENSLYSAMDTGVPSEDTPEMLAQLAGLGEKGREVAQAYREAFAGAGQVWGVVEDTRFKSVPEQVEALKTLKPAPGQPDYKAQAKLYEHGLNLVGANIKAFQEDPAGYVRQEAERMVREAGIEPGGSELGQREFDMLVRQKSKQLQADMGSLQPQVLAKQEVQGIKAQLDAAEPEQRIEIVNGLSAYGGDMHQAAREIGLGPVDTYTAMLNEVDPILAREVALVAGMDAKELGLESDLAREYKTTVNQDFYTTSMGEVLNAQGQLTKNPAYSGMARELENLTVRVALYRKDADKALEQLWDHYSYVVEPENAVVWIPQRYDPDTIMDGLEFLRQGLKPEDVDGGESETYFEQAVRGAVWKNTDDGEGFVLIDPVLGSAITRDGRPLSIGLDEAATLGIGNHQFNDFEILIQSGGWGVVWGR